MSLASLLSAEQIIPEMKATERWPAIVELIDLLVASAKNQARAAGKAFSPRSNNARKR